MILRDAYGHSYTAIVFSIIWLKTFEYFAAFHFFQLPFYPFPYVDCIYLYTNIYYSPRIFFGISDNLRKLQFLLSFGTFFFPFTIYFCSTWSLENSTKQPKCDLLFAYHLPIFLILFPCSLLYMRIFLNCCSIPKTAEQFSELPKFLCFIIRFRHCSLFYHFCQFWWTVCNYDEVESHRNIWNTFNSLWH